MESPIKIDGAGENGAFPETCSENWCFPSSRDGSPSGLHGANDHVVDHLAAMDVPQEP